MKILRELDFNARQPISQIAKTVGLSPEVTAYRIKQLERKGIITGYYPVINLSKLGYLFCRFRFVLEGIPPEIEEQFIEAAKKIPSVGWVIVSGHNNISMVVYAKSIDEAVQASDQITSKFQKIIKSKMFSVAYRIYYLRRNYLYQTKEDEQLVWESDAPVTIDTTDKKILVLLNKDARMTYTDIAQEIGMTSMAVFNRIKKMQKERLILGYRCALNLKKLGYSHHKMSLFLEKGDKGRMNALKETLRLCPQVVYITEALGPYDLEFEMHVRSNYYAYEFLKKVRAAFPEIKSCESTIFYREEIVRHFPEGG